MKAIRFSGFQMRPEYGNTFRFDRILNVYFYTSNLDKLYQARLIFMRWGYLLKHYRGNHEPYDEDYSYGTELMLSQAVRQVSSEFNVRSLFFVEDTSLRIDALSGDDDFPGMRVKEWFKATNFSELDAQLRRGRSRAATVKSDIALFVPNLARPLFFHGATSGIVAPDPPSFDPSAQYPWLTPHTFNGWFIPEGSAKRLGEMEFEESLAFDFRVKSLKQLLSRLEELNSALNLGPTFYTTRVQQSRGPLRQLLLLPPERPEIVVVVGPKCAGKTTLSDYMARNDDVLAIEASTILRRLAADHNAPLGNARDALIFLEKQGWDIVARDVVEILRRSEARLNLITGLRTVQELLYIAREFPHIRILLVEADVKTRYERHLRRARDRGVETLDEFQLQDEEQANFGVMRVKDDVADLVIRNDGSLQQFHARIDAVMTSTLRREMINYGTPLGTSELFRCLRALDEIGRPATCDEISARTGSFGNPVLRYNTNRALKAAPEFAKRITRPRELLQYSITEHGRALIALAAAACDRGAAFPEPSGRS
jgi:inosine/xanthosine triphosphate pyrophosphatase family protein/dephospho-CoA kinase